MPLPSAPRCAVLTKTTLLPGDRTRRDGRHYQLSQVTLHPRRMHTARLRVPHIRSLRGPTHGGFSGGTVQFMSLEADPRASDAKNQWKVQAFKTKVDVACVLLQSKRLSTIACHDDDTRIVTLTQRLTWRGCG
eukprot:1980944-Rhodomonas_salina.2